MRICKEEIKTTEKKIKDYFWRLKKIEFYRGSILSTQENLKRVQQNIEKSNIIFYTTYSSIDYSKDKVQGSHSIYNGIEREIDSTFHRLEKQERELKEKLTLLQMSIDCLNLENEEFKCVLSELNEESKRIIDLKYRKNKSLDTIAIELNSSTASIGRKREQILQDIAQWLYVVY